jgi:hypothetical protein
MATFRDAASLMNAMARRPSVPDQRRARGEALKPLVTVAKGILEANGNRITGKYIASLGVASVSATMSAAGPMRTRQHHSLGVLLEFGTAPHWQPRRMRMHPGAAAFPHLRPAYDTTKVQMVQVLGREIIRSITQGLV